MIPRHGQPPDPSLILMSVNVLGLAILLAVVLRVRPKRRRFFRR